MAVTTQNKNFAYFRYVDDQARNWAIRAEQDWGSNAASGLVAFNAADPPFGRQSRRRHVRYGIYQDPGSFRTFRAVFGTGAAYAAAPATIARPMYGASTAVNYAKKALVAEKMPIPAVARQDGQDSLAA